MYIYIQDACYSTELTKVLVVNTDQPLIRIVVVNTAQPLSKVFLQIMYNR